jgi:hypothetical protein
MLGLLGNESWIFQVGEKDFPGFGTVKMCRYNFSFHTMTFVTFIGPSLLLLSEAFAAKAFIWPASLSFYPADQGGETQ